MKRNLTRPLTCKITAVILLMSSSLVLANDSGQGWLFYDDARTSQKQYQPAARGYHWYNEEKDSPIENFNNDQLVSKAQAVDALRTLQLEVEETKALAVMNPTVENVRDYISLQNQVSANAERFSIIWEQTKVLYPELDYSLQKPTDNAAKQVYLDEYQENRARSIRALADTHGLFFFFRSDCVYCQQFAPILKQFELMYGITIIGVSLDGIGIPGFTDFEIDNGAAEALGVVGTPSLFAVEPRTGKSFAITHGMMSMEDLSERMLMLTIVENEV